MEKDIPKDRYLANLSFCFIDMDIPVYIMVINNDATIRMPANPNSSLIMEKIKSV